MTLHLIPEPEENASELLRDLTANDTGTGAFSRAQQDGARIWTDRPVNNVLEQDHRSSDGSTRVSHFRSFWGAWRHRRLRGDSYDPQRPGVSAVGAKVGLLHHFIGMFGMEA